MKKGTDQKDKLVALRRVEGQVRGVIKMIEDGRYCVDILNTIASVRGALKKIEAGILKNHLDACVRNAFEGQSEKEKENKLREICGLFESSRK
jgi:DNA-binding FrmR family transcriptional regulator